MFYHRSSLHLAMDAMRIIELAQEERDRPANRNARAMRVFPDRTNPLEMFTDTQFVKRYRISKDSFRWLLELISNDLQHPTNRSRALLPIEQLSITLQFFARAAFWILVILCVARHRLPAVRLFIA